MNEFELKELISLLKKAKKNSDWEYVDEVIEILKELLLPSHDKKKMDETDYGDYNN